MTDKEAVQMSEKQVYNQSDLETATICGLPKRAFICVVVFATVVLSVAIALGVGLGIGLRSQVRNDGTSAASAAASASATATTSTAPTSTTSGVTMYTGTRSKSCPYSNGTKTTTAGLDYIIICDSAVLSPNKTDLFHVYQPSFEACLELCASKGRKDVSVTYNYGGTFGQVYGTCWCSANTASGMYTTVEKYDGNDVALIQ